MDKNAIKKYAVWARTELIYLPSRVRVFTDEHNQFNPQILTEAISLEMAGLDMEKVYAYKDANDDEGLFKYLIF